MIVTGTFATLNESKKTQKSAEAPTYEEALAQLKAQMPGVLALTLPDRADLLCDRGTAPA